MANPLFAAPTKAAAPQAAGGFGFGAPHSSTLNASASASATSSAAEPFGGFSFAASTAAPIGSAATPSPAVSGGILSFLSSTGSANASADAKLQTQSPAKSTAATTSAAAVSATPTTALTKQPSAPVPRFKVVLLGEGGVGKTTFVKRHSTGEFEKRYVATRGAEVTALKLYTTHGAVICDIWDTAGQEKLGGLRDGYYIGAHAAILMFDVTSRCTYSRLPVWYKDLRRVVDDALPVVVVGNKVDVKDRKVKPKDILFHRKRNLQYYDVSARSNYHFELPFLYLLRKLSKQPQLQFAAQIAPSLVDVTYDPQQLAKDQAELDQLQQTKGFVFDDKDDEDL